MGQCKTKLSYIDYSQLNTATYTADFRDTAAMHTAAA